LAAASAAGADRSLEFHGIDARGGPGHARLLAEGAQALFFGKEGVDHLAVPDADGVPAGSDDAAEMAMGRQFRIDVEILGIVERGEADDFGFGEGVLAEVEHLVDDDVLEPAGHAATPPRHSTRLARRMVSTGLPCRLRTSKSSVTMPHWGCEAERRSSAMVA